jgi:putative transposase
MPTVDRTNKLYVAPTSLWGKGYREEFNSTYRVGFLNGKIFYSLSEARTVIER